MGLNPLTRRGSGVGVALAFAFCALVAPSASANHIGGATYNGTHAQGGAISFTVSADGNGITAFNVGGPVQGNSCSFGGSSATYPTPLPITNHTFSDTTPPLTFQGSFPGVQSAQGTFTITTTNPSCTTGAVSWSATTTAPPPPPPVQCVIPNVDNKKLAKAKGKIKAAHCSVGTVRKRFSENVRKGRVISQKPKPGTVLPEGSPVNLKVSKGKRG